MIDGTVGVGVLQAVKYLALFDKESTLTTRNIGTIRYFKGDARQV